MRRLSRNDDAYRQIFGVHSKAVLLLEENLQVADCNDQALVLFRCPREALVGTSAIELVPAQQSDGSDSVQGLRDAVAAALAGLPQSLLGHLSAADRSRFEALVQIEAVDLDGRDQQVAIIGPAIVDFVSERSPAVANGTQGPDCVAGHVRFEPANPSLDLRDSLK